VITDAILGLIHGVLEGLVSLLPTYTLPSWGTQMGAVPTAVGFANSFLPLSEMFEVIAWVVAAAGVWLTAYIIMKVIDWLPIT